MKIRLTKIKTVANPLYPTETDKTLQAGELKLSPWVDYYVEGYCDTLPEIGESFSFPRTIRNGILSLGFFSTSQIQAISKNFAKGLNKMTDMEIITLNSIYKLEILEE